MKHEWVLAVLADIQTYAERNGLKALEAKLDETLAAARRDTGMEPGSHRGDAPAEGDGSGIGRFHRRLAAGEHA